MQLKKLLFGLACVLVVFATFCAGYTAGKNRSVKRELNVSIPVLVQIYRSIKDGNSNKASGLTSMVLMGKIDRYDSLMDDWLFRLTTGSELFDSAKLQKYVAEARGITKAERTNLITLGPETSK